MTNVSGTSQNNNFFNKIGQAFKRGWNNGNLAKGVTALGATTFTVGMTGAMIHDLNNNSGCCRGGSIFSGMFGGGCNYPATMGMLGGSLWGMGGMPMGMGMGMPMSFTGMSMGMPGVSSMPGATNMGFMGLTGGMDPYAYGQMYMQQIMAQNPGTTTTGTSTGTVAGVKKQDNEYAGKWEEDQSTEAGSKFDTATNKMIDKDGNAVDGKEFKLSEEGNNNNIEKYKNDLLELAKSYAAHMEQNGKGTVNQELSMQEFVKFELSKLPENATADERQAAENMAKIAYARIDLNQDGKADYKEIAATMATFDKNADGTLTSTELAEASDAMTDASKADFSNTLIQNYKKLFGSSEE